MTRATPVQLEGPGPFVTPAVKAFLALGYFPAIGPQQLCLILEEGRELRLPMSPDVLEELLRRLDDFVPKADSKSGK